MGRDPTSEKLDTYEYKMALLKNDKLKEFFLFMYPFKNICNASGALIYNMKLKYIRNLLRGEELYQFDILGDQVGSNTLDNLNQVILALGTYFSCERII